MGPSDYNDSMPGLPPVNAANEFAELGMAVVTTSPKTAMGAPCPDCVETSGGWRCICTVFDGVTVQQQPPGTIHITPEQQAVLENVLAAEEHVGLPHDNVNLPHHYARFKIEPIRFICENGLNFFQGNIVKYTLRHDAKNGLEDIDKVIRYATMYRKWLAGDPDWWKASK